MRKANELRGRGILDFVMEKEANPGMPPMGGAPMPPMDPAMMGGAPMPPMDPAMMGGAPPMDPAMMGGMPPMDPAMMGGMPPMDPAMGGMPMDPAMGGMPPMDPAMDPAMGGMPMDPAMGGMPPVDPAMVPEGMDVGQDQTNDIIENLTATVEKLTKTIDKMAERLSKMEEGNLDEGGEDELPSNEDSEFANLLEDDIDDDLTPIAEAMPDEVPMDAQAGMMGDVEGEEEQALENPEEDGTFKEASVSSTIQDILKKHGITK